MGDYENVMRMIDGWGKGPPPPPHAVSGVAVRGCKDCPYVRVENYRFEGGTDRLYCGADPDSRTIVHGFAVNPVPPDWCPLRRGPVTIHLAEGGDDGR